MSTTRGVCGKLEDLTDDELLLFRAVAENHRPSRSEILRRSPWGSSKTDTILRRLVEKRLVVTRRDRTGGKGRSPHVYSVNPDIGFFVGAETNVCHDRLALVDYGGSVVLTREFPPSYAKPDILAALQEHILDTVSQSGLPADRLLGAGIGLHKRIGERVGDISRILLDGVTVELSTKEHLESALGVPVYVASKRSYVLHREYRYDLNRLGDPVVNALLEYGVSLGIFQGGELYRGQTGMSGQIGHLIVPENPRRCYCGNVGCLRTLVSFQALCTLAQENLDRGITSSVDPSRVRGPDFRDGVEHIIDKALENDKLAIKLVHDAGSYFGAALAGAISIVNPPIIIIHSSLVRAGEIFTAPVRVNIQGNTLDASIGRLKIEFTPLEPFAVAEGAALYAIRKTLNTRAAVVSG